MVVGQNILKSDTEILPIKEILNKEASLGDDMLIVMIDCKLS